MSDSITKLAAPRPRGEKRREALLEATIKLIGETGIDNVTHRNVAQVAGLPLASTTYWFATKDELLEQAFQFAADRDVALLESRVVQARTLDEPVKAIVRVVLPPDEDQTISRPRAIAAYALWLEAARRPSLRKIARRWTDAYVTAVSEFVDCHGSTRPGDDAQLLIATVDGLVLDQLAQHTTSDLRPAIERLAIALLESPQRLRAAPEPAK